MPFIFTRKGIKEPDIRMYFRYSGKTLKFDTGEKVKKASDWHKEKQRVKGAVTGAGEINDVLDSIESKVKNIYRQFKTDGSIPSPGELKSKLSFVEQSPQKRQRKMIRKYSLKPSKNF